MQALEIVTHRRRSDERPLALLANENLLSHQRLDRLSERDAAHAVSRGQHGLGIQAITGLEAAAADRTLQNAGKLTVQRLRTGAAQRGR